MKLKKCVYCGLEKDEAEFSHEHIWPDALGGDFLDDTWKTDDVCQKCNGMSGVFVDGAFIKSWMGSAERAIGAREYLSVDNPGRGAIPLHYMGALTDMKTQQGELAEFWLGACGDHIVHFRPEDKEDLWASYTGGDPRRESKKAWAGRAYLSFTSMEPFWILVTVASFKAHFQGKRYIVNAELPPEWTGFEKPNSSDPIQVADLAVVETIREAARKQENIRTSLVLPLDLGGRFLAKLGLAIQNVWSRLSIDPICTNTSARL